MAISSDNVKHSKRPDKWNMREIIGISTVVGLLDVFFTLLLFSFGYYVLLKDPGIIEAGKVIFPAINHY